MMNKRITIKDIAKISGFSVNCVSRALMDAPDISRKTKDKIKQIADEMGYVHNRNAASLRTKKSKTIGILYDSLLNPFYHIMTNYIWGKLHEYGYNILTFKNDYAIFDEDMARQIVSLNVDGLLSFLQPSPEAQSFLDVSRMPIVVIGRKTHGMCDCVYLDDEKGGRLAAQNFISRGFKKPLYMGETKHLDCSFERGTGFYEEFKKVGIEAELAFLENLDEDKYAAYFDRLYGTGDLPDCIFCFSDQSAYQIVADMDRKGIEHIAVIGFDNIQKEMPMPGTLTSVSYNKKEMTDTAVTFLLNKINGINDGHEMETLISDLSVSFTKPKIKVN